MLWPSPGMRALFFSELDGNYHTNYEHVATGTSTWFGSSLFGVSILTPLTERFNATLGFQQLSEFGGQITTPRYYHAANSSFALAMTPTLNASLTLSYQNFQDTSSLVPTDSIVSGISLHVGYALSPDLSGYLEPEIRKINTSDQQNLRLTAGLEAMQGPHFATLSTGVSAYAGMSEPSGDHTDLILDGTIEWQPHDNWAVSLAGTLTQTRYSYTPLRYTTTRLSVKTEYAPLTEWKFFTSLEFYQRNAKKTGGYTDLGFHFGMVFQPSWNLAGFLYAAAGNATEDALNALFEQGKTEHRNLNYQAAAQIFERILEQDADYVPAYYLLGYDYVKLGKPEKAKPIFEALYTLTQDPDIEAVLKTLD